MTAPSVGTGRVRIYRIFVVDPEGRTRPPLVVECADDGEVIRQAREYLDDKPVAVWEGTNCVAWLEPKSRLDC
jgi:hypothetical protein